MMKDKPGVVVIIREYGKGLVLTIGGFTCFTDGHTDDIRES